MKNNPVILLSPFLKAPLALAADSTHPSDPAAFRVVLPFCDQLAVRY
jgi:hypothetical protein